MKDQVGKWNQRQIEGINGLHERNDAAKVLMNQYYDDKEKAIQELSTLRRENEELKEKLKVKESFTKRFEELNERYLAATTLMSQYHTEKEFLSKRNEELEKTVAEDLNYLELRKSEIRPHHRNKEVRDQMIGEIKAYRKIESLLSSVNKEKDGYTE